MDSTTVMGLKASFGIEVVPKEQDGVCYQKQGDGIKAGKVSSYPLESPIIYVVYIFYIYINIIFCSY